MDSGGMSTGLLASVWRAGVRAHGGGDQTIFLGYCYGSTMLPWRLHPVQQNTQMAALSLSLSLSETVQLASHPWPANHKSWSPCRFRKTLQVQTCFWLSMQTTIFWQKRIGLFIPCVFKKLQGKYCKIIHPKKYPLIYLNILYVYNTPIASLYI